VIADGFLAADKGFHQLSLHIVNVQGYFACKTVKGQLEVDKSFSAEVQEIESLLKKRN
jgi:hypothetical protein